MSPASPRPAVLPHCPSESCAPPATGLGACLRPRFQKAAAVLVVVEDRLAPVAAVQDVVGGSRVLKSQRPRHATPSSHTGTGASRSCRCRAAGACRCRHGRSGSARSRDRTPIHGGEWSGSSPPIQSGLRPESVWGFSPRIQGGTPIQTPPPTELCKTTNHFEMHGTGTTG
jgi:hypothetical protein